MVGAGASAFDGGCTAIDPVGRHGAEPTDISTQAPTHQAIYRRWRAQTFAQVVGQEAVVETLRNAVRTEVAHAILFVGPRGTGKTSLARILAKAINCTNLQDGDPCDACPSCIAIREGRAIDLLEIDAASNRGIDAIRDLRERINYAPTDLRRKVYILDEAHQITKDAWNALLKSLEEPPDFVVFMFASTHPQEFPPAILSRLQRFDVRRLTIDEIEGKLGRILEADGRTASPRPSTSSPDSPRAACATPSPCSTSSCPRRPTSSMNRASATSSAWPTPRRCPGSSTRSSPPMPRRACSCSTGSRIGAATCAASSTR